ncbi:HdeD family acid-resistance protein [Neisseria sp. Ec49-e6-T10]|uniref:HdeD family acid-resistance protein n=1 Tax=Neisseria sp. Ec49-e6-T10 TaxID=3140744 RepID=UPI003EC00ECB
MSQQEEIVKKFVKESGKKSSLVIGLGVLLVILGMGALSFMYVTTITITYFFGFLMIIGGVLQIISSFQIYQGSHKWLWALFGLLYVFGGVFVVNNPLLTTYVFTVLLACTMIVGGVVRIINGFALRPMSGWGWPVFSGLLTLITGVMIVSIDGSWLWVIGLFLGVDMVFQGWTFVSLGFALKSLSRQ